MMVAITTYLAIQALLLWLVSVVRRDSSLFDRWWGLSFCVVSWIVLFHTSHSLSQMLMLAMIHIWGLRLSYHITKRNWGKGEDERYGKMRQTIQGYAWKSLGIVFIFQSVLVFVVALPITSVEHPIDPFNTITQILGFSIWLIGLLIEIIADQQLKGFRQRRSDPQQICDTGVWAWCRHPNYFGDALVWWGIGLYAFSMDQWWVLFSPLLMTYLLMHFTGVGPLEEKMLKEKVNYRAYVDRVPAFWPNLKSLFNV